MERTTIPGDIDRAIDALVGPNGAQVVTEHRARHVAEQLAQRAFDAGRRAAYGDLRTTDDAMAATGRTRRWVIALAERHGLGWRVGRDWLFTVDELATMQAIVAASRPGRPRTTTAQAET